jgi:hypothetical protein
MRRWGLAAVLAVLVAAGAGWGELRSGGGPARGAGPASVELALPAGVAQLAPTRAGRFDARRRGRSRGPLGRARPRRGRRLRRSLSSPRLGRRPRGSPLVGHAQILEALSNERAVGVLRRPRRGSARAVTAARAGRTGRARHP